MSAMPKADDRITEAEYFALLKQSEGVKYELIDGYIYAMVGGKSRHYNITSQLNVIIGNGTRGKNCTYFSGEAPVAVPSGNYFYPDLSVVCGVPEYLESKPIDILANPTLIVEVLSPSTERKDRTVKFDNYRTIPTLREYVLISQDTPRVERFSLKEDGEWTINTAIGLDATIELPSIGVTLALADVYERVTFEPPQTNGDTPDPE